MTEKGEPKSSLARPDATDLVSAPRNARPIAPGRLGTFAMLGGVAGGVPLPWVPDALQRRVRGALAQDVAARHGLSLSPEARTVLAEPGMSGEPHRGVAAQALGFLTRKVLVRFGPLGMLPPVRACLHTFVLGHLFARYLGTRSLPSVRIDVGEARTVRGAMDRALFHLLNADLEAEQEADGFAPEDLRDDITQIVDGVLIATAGFPSWLVRRLDASFDDILATSPVHG